MDPGGQIDRAVWRVCVVVVLGTLITSLDSTALNIALDTLSKSLDAPLTRVQWVVSGYLLATAAVVPLAGWTARRFGAKRTFLVTIVLYLAGAVLCGSAPTASALIVFRTLQGLGGGMLLPIGLMLLVQAAGPAHLARVMGVWGAAVLVGSIGGPTVGGVILDALTWRWIFFICIPFGAVALVLGRRWIPADVREDAGPLDRIGWLLVAVGLVGVTYGLAKLGGGGSRAWIAVCLIGGSVLVAAFVVRSLRVEHPLLDMRLYANRMFSVSSVNTFFVGGVVMVGTTILLPLYFQVVRLEDPLDTALLLIPRGLAATVAMLMAGRLTERFGAGRTAVTGSLLTFLATVPFVMVQADTSYVTTSVLTSLQAFGLGLAGMPVMIAAYRTLRPSQVHDATPQQNILQRLGGSMGAAILAAVLTSQLAGAGSSPSAQADAFATTSWLLLGATALALIPTTYLWLVERRHGPTLGMEVPVEELAGEVAIVALEGG